MADRDLLVKTIEDIIALGKDEDDVEGSLIRDVRRLWQQAAKAIGGLPESDSVLLFLNAIKAGLQKPAIQAGKNILREAEGKPPRGL